MWLVSVRQHNTCRDCSQATGEASKSQAGREILFNPSGKTHFLRAACLVRMVISV
jgi:hypothetical protein